MFSLCSKLLFELAFSRIHSISEKVQITARPFHIFFDLNPDCLVYKVLTPKRAIFVIQGVLLDLAVVCTDVCLACLIF